MKRLMAPYQVDSPLGVFVEKTSADETNATQVMSNISSLAMTVAKAGKYKFEVFIPYRCSVTGNGISVDLTGPSTSFLSFQTEIQSNTTTFRKDWKTAFSSAASLSSTGSNSLDFGVWLKGRLTATASGTLQPRYCLGGATAATLTVKTGAFAELVPCG